MANHSVLVQIPATVGNLGGARDCSAMALDAFLNVKVTPRFDGQVGIRYFGDNGERVPRDRSNLVVQALEAALHAKGLVFTGADFEIYSSVPVAVGLGSSTAAVLAGLIAAEHLFRLGLSEKTLFDLAASYEDRQDNLRAAWWGGFVSGGEEAFGLAYRRTAIPENFRLHVVIPDVSLVAGSRRLRPSAQAGNGSISYQSRATSIADFFAHTAAGLELSASESTPPTCEKMVPGLEEVLNISIPGVLSVFICGSGPAIGILARANAEPAVAAVRECFSRHRVGSLGMAFRPTNSGARDRNAVLPDITLPALGGRSRSVIESTPIPV